MRVGPTVAERDVDECMRRAEAASASERGENQSAAVDTIASTAVGAAAGGAGGAVVGHAGQGAAIGAASAAAVSTMYALLRALFAPHQPRPGYRGFVDRCLRDKGYDPVGWQ